MTLLHQAAQKAVESQKREPFYTCCEDGMLSQVPPTDRSGLCPACKATAPVMCAESGRPCTKGFSDACYWHSTVGALGSDRKLWCVNVWGPDDIYAMPSKAAALDRANSMNIEFGSIPRHEHDPIMLAVVIEWPHTPESHAEDLSRYAASPSTTQQQEADKDKFNFDEAFQEFQRDRIAAARGHDAKEARLPPTTQQQEVGSGWKPIESAPKNEVVLLAAEFDRPGDWRIKCGFWFEEAGFWRVWGASWTPTHWMPLPASPSTPERAEKDTSAPSGTEGGEHA